jgi:hypothetical protein
MKPENLESLLLDRALGQLAPEVADLLDEHLRQNPAAAARAATLGATLDLARRAVAVPASAPTTPAPLPWTRIQRMERWQRISRETLKLAACVALGLAAGWALRPASPEKGALIASAQVLPLPPPVPEKNAAALFWSTARLQAAAAAASAGARPDTLPPPIPRWPLPVKNPDAANNP